MQEPYFSDERIRTDDVHSGISFPAGRGPTGLSALSTVANAVDSMELF